ncbi:MAG: hypothetical protein ACPLWC_04690 [Candidatus Woesearchaeota archaeon]
MFFLKEKRNSNDLKSKSEISSLLFIFISTIMFFLFQSKIVFGIGFAIAPAFKNADFVPFFNDTVSIRVYNNINSTLNVSVSMIGDLKDYAVLEKNQLLIKPFSYETLSLKISLPEKIDFGEHILRVLFSSYETSGTIGSALTLNFDYKVFFKEQETLTQEFFLYKNYLVLKLKNSADKEISGFSEVYFYDFEKQVGFLNKTFVLQPNAELVIKERLEEVLPSIGEYSVFIKTYSPNLNELEKNFTIGTPEIILKNINIGNETGSVRTLSFDLGLNWNKPLDVFAEVFIINDSRIISSFKSAAIKIYPNKTENLKMFLDLSGLENEKFLNLRIAVNCQGKVYENNVNLIKNKRGVYEVNRMNAYYFLIILLAMLNLFLLLRLIFFSKNKLKRVKELIKETENLVEQGKLNEALKSYKKIKELYDNSLSKKEKKEVYDDVMKAYHKIHERLKR